jgi:hypothetical protein
LRVLAVLGLVVFVMGFGPAMGALWGGDLAGQFYQRLHYLLREPTGGEAVSENSVLFFGPSDIAVNFSPLDFDKHMNGITGVSWRSYNLGVLMAGPDVISGLVAQTRKNLGAKNERVSLTLIRFMPMMYTNQYKWLAERQLDRFLYPISPNAIGNKEELSWESYVNRAYYRLFPFTVGAGSGGGVLHILLADWLFFDGQPRAYGAGWSNYSSRYNKFANLENRKSGLGVWSHRDRGHIPPFDPVDERDRATLFLAGYLTHRVNYDFEGLNFDARHFDSLEKMIDDARSFSDKVVLVYLEDFLVGQTYGRTPLGKERLRKVLDEFGNRKDVKFLDLTEAFDSKKEDFIDLVHMTSVGQSKFNKVLSRKVSEIIAR